MFLGHRQHVFNGDRCEIFANRILAAMGHFCQFKPTLITVLLCRGNDVVKLSELQELFHCTVWNCLKKFGMSTLFGLQYVPMVFFLKNAEKYGQNCMKLTPPPQNGQISADSEQLGKPLRNSHIRPGGLHGALQLSFTYFYLLPGVGPDSWTCKSTLMNQVI